MDDYHERLPIVTLITLSFTFFSCTYSSPETPSTESNVSIHQPKKQIFKNPFTKKKVKPKKNVQVQIADTLRIDTTKTYFYLTFDDGPQPGTLNCLDVLKQQKVKGTFFLIAEHALQSHHTRNIVDSIRKDSSCLLANHSYTHAFNNKYKLFYTHTDSATNDFIRAQDSMNIPYKIVRLPGNDSWAVKNKIRSTKLTQQVSEQLDSLGYNIIGWDVEWNFSYKTGKPVQSTDSMLTLIRNMKEKKRSFTSKHIVLLTHDRMFKDQAEKDSLVKLIRELRKDTQYVFQNVDRYPNLKN